MTALFDVAKRMADLGISERPGNADHPFVLWALERAGFPEPHDEIAWCGAGLGLVCDLLGLPSPHARARARQWLTVGTPVELVDARAGDIMVLSRGDNPPAADVLDAPGHVAIYEERSEKFVFLIGGNQNNRWCYAGFPVGRVLGVRRL